MNQGYKYPGSKQYLEDHIKCCPTFGILRRFVVNVVLTFLSGRVYTTTQSFWIMICFPLILNNNRTRNK